jgi:hypothetical protein
MIRSGELASDLLGLDLPTILEIAVEMGLPV